MTPQAPGGGRAGSRVRFRYRQREDSKPGDRHYDVFKQERPRARWEPLGWVVGLSHESGPTSWAGLRDGADAWTEWKTTRGAAAQDMAEGRTFLTPTHERAAQEARAGYQRMRAEAAADEARMAAGLAALPELEA